MSKLVKYPQLVSMSTYIMYIVNGVCGDYKSTLSSVHIWENVYQFYYSTS